MSERMTGIYLPGFLGSGLADYGRKTPAEMIAQLRADAANRRWEAEKILAAADEDFRVETYVGVHVQRNKIVLQKGHGKP